MIYTRRPERKYFLGIDLHDDFCQISYLNARRFPSESEPRTFSLVAGGEAFNLPAAGYFQGEEHGDTIGHILRSAAAGETDSGGGQSEDAVSLLTGLLKYFLSMLSAEVPTEEIEAICITMEQTDRVTAQIIRRAASEAGIPEDKIYCEDHLRSFYSYIVMQDEEQKRHSVLLADGWQKGRISLTGLSFNRRMKPVVCSTHSRVISMADQTAQEQTEDRTADQAQEKDQVLTHALREIFDKEEVSAAYLTGYAFDGGWMRESLDLICSGRRAFQGDNLYSKGAVCSLLAGAGLAERADRYFFLGKEALRCNIGVRCENRHRESYRALLDAGTDWADARSELEFILDGDSEIVLQQTPVDGNEPREIAVTLENMPQRPQRTGRLRMRLHMSAVDRLHISVEDLGFGEIFPSSGMRWEQEIDIG